MRLPNPDRAVVDLQKLRDYCLNPTSPRGRTKAPVFEAVLGLRAADAEQLRRHLLRAAFEAEGTPGEKDEFGQRYTVDFIMESNTGYSLGAKRMDCKEKRGYSPADNVLCSVAKTSVMKKRRIKLLEAVALAEDLPGRTLRAGEVGTVVELLGSDAYEVEFCNERGETYAEFALRGDQIIPLHTRGKSLAAALVES